MLRSDFASPEAATSVKLEFTYQGESYLVERSPRYERAKKNGKGTTWKSPRATLVMPNGKVISGYTNVTEAIIRGCFASQQGLNRRLRAQRKGLSP